MQLHPKVRNLITMPIAKQHEAMSRLLLDAEKKQKETKAAIKRKK